MANYDRGVKAIELPGAEHLALVLVLDVSYSMNSQSSGSGTPPIDLLNEGVNQMIAGLSADAKLSKTVDLAIITFADPNDAQVYQDFAPIGSVTPISLIADGRSTYASQAIELAIEKARERTKIYTKGAWKPWIVFITDGELHDDITLVGQKARERETEGKQRMLCLGVGDGFDAQQLHLLTDKVYKLDGYNFSSFFDWLGKSVAVISDTATSGSAGYGVVNGAAVNLPSNQDPHGQIIFTPTF